MTDAGAPDRDYELVARTATGDQVAFEELVSRHERAVLNTIHRYVGEYDAADDIAQEVFVILWRKAGSFKGNARFSTWLYRVVVNQCLQFRRKRRARPGTVSLDSMDGDNPPESLQVAEDHEKRRRAEAVRSALAQLPDRQRIALVLAHYEGHTYQEVAEMMQTSVSSVESLIFRAKCSLREKLIDQI